MTVALETAPHEFDANLIYDEYGLQPFFALDSIIKRHDGGPVRRRFNLDGESFQAKLYYQESGLKPRDHPEFRIQTVREFRVQWQAANDGPGQRSGTLHVAPRWPDMETKDGKKPSVPPDLLGINVRVQGSNLEFDRYPALVKWCMAAFGLRDRYFQQLHRYSNVQDAERYVRVAREEAGRLHAQDGIVARLANFMVSDRDGYRKHVADDTKAAGYYHTATVGEKRAGELVNGHRLPKEVKVYLPREPESFSPDEPLYHHKLGVSYQRSLDDGPVKWRGSSDTLERLSRELDEALLNVLNWAGFPTRAASFDRDDHDQNTDVDGDRADQDDLADQDECDDQDDEPARGGVPGRRVGPFVEDAYWGVGESERNVSLLPDPTPTLKEVQKSVVIKHLTDGLAGSDWATLETLVTDGGTVAPADVAERSDYHLDTIYAALDRLDDLVEHDYGEVKLRSPFVAEKVTEAVQHVHDAFEDAAETAAKAIQTTGERVEHSALIEWMHANGVDVDDRSEAQLELRLGGMDPRTDVKQLLRRGLAAWREAGRDLQRFKNATVRYKKDGQHHVRRRALADR